MDVARRLASASVLVALAAAAPVRAGAELPRRHAVLVGVDRNVAAGVAELKYAERDAKRLRDALVDQGYRVDLLLGADDKAGREDIVARLLWCQDNLTPDDDFVLYYAGHGVVRERNQQVYWLVQDGDPLRPDVRGLRLSHLMELVREIPAGRKLVLLDHCHAGSVLTAAPGLGRDAPGTPGVDVTAREAVPPGFAENLAAGRRQAGPFLVVIAASRGVAFELVKDMHGLFTSVLLDAMRTSAADSGSVLGAIEVSELLAFVNSEVKRRSREAQLEQDPVAPAEGDTLSNMSWTPFLRTLQAAEIDQAAQRYEEQVRQWVNDQYMTQGQQVTLERLLRKWSAATDPLKPEEVTALAITRRLLDTPPPAVSEASRAAALGQSLDFQLEP